MHVYYGIFSSIFFIVQTHILVHIFTLKMHGCYGSRDTFADLMKVLQDPFVRELLEVPTLVFIAPQSAGKSLFISLRAGYPITFSDPNIGTRCPVRYEFRDSSAIDDFEGTKINGIELPKERLLEAVRDHMLKLKNLNQFSDDEIVVLWAAPGIQNAIYIDLPGFPDASKPHYPAVREIIRKKAQGSHTILVGLLPAEAVDPVMYMD